MPGYDTNRFVDLTQTEKLELVCSICQDILRCPVVTICCIQSFCSDCINSWIKINNTCPYDRKRLTTEELLRAPRAMMNALGKLKIRCDFSDNGCNDVIYLGNLKNHLQQCQYNNENKECRRCFFKNSNEFHDCVGYLLDTNNKITFELNQLKISYEELSETHRNISTELNQLKKIHEDVIKNLDTSITNESNAYLLQLIEESKKLRNCVETNSNITSINKLRDIYKAKSLPQLKRKAEEACVKVTQEIYSRDQEIDVLTYSKSALKLYSSAKIAVNDGEEERAYVLFYRFINLYEQIRNFYVYRKPQQFVEQMIGTAKVNEAIKQSHQLSRSLVKRYEELHSRERERCDSIADMHL